MKMVIFGTTPYAKLLRYTMKKEAGIETEAYCLTENYLNEKEFDDRPVVAFEQLDNLFGKNAFEVLLTLGYKGMNRAREHFFHECDERGYQIASFIHPSVKIDAVHIGRGNIIMEGSRVYPFSNIGDGNIFNAAVIGHENHIGNFNFTSRCCTSGLVKIGNNCFIGNGAILGDNISVGDCCIVGAGACLVKNLKANTIISPPRMRTMKADPEILGGLFK